MDLHEPRKKMSKSAKFPGGMILLTDPPEAIRSKIAAATMDSEHDIHSSPHKLGISNLIAIHSLVAEGSEDSEARFSGKTYAEFKSILADEVIEFLRPFRERYELFRQDRGFVERILLEGSYRAQAAAIPTLVRVHERIGFLE